MIDDERPKPKKRRKPTKKARYGDARVILHANRDVIADLIAKKYTIIKMLEETSLNVSYKSLQSFAKKLKQELLNSQNLIVEEKETKHEPISNPPEVAGFNYNPQKYKMEDLI